MIVVLLMQGKEIEAKNKPLSSFSFSSSSPT
jgi:hypothetical protein